MQQRGKHTSTTIKLLLEIVLCNPLLGTCNSWTTTMENGVFSMCSVPWSYLEDTGATQLVFSSKSLGLGGWCDMAASLGLSQLSVES
jgi:hypothetical protein